MGRISSPSLPMFDVQTEVRRRRGVGAPEPRRDGVGAAARGPLHQHGVQPAGQVRSRLPQPHTQHTQASEVRIPRTI